MNYNKAMRAFRRGNVLLCGGLVFYNMEQIKQGRDGVTLRAFLRLCKIGREDKTNA